MTNNGQNFMREMAEAYAAYEREPGYKETIDLLSHDLERERNRIAERQSIIDSLQAQISDLAAKLHATEVERDDAGFRVLEAEDRTANAIATIRTQATLVREALAVLEPQKVEPVASAASEPSAIAADESAPPLPSADGPHDHQTLVQSEPVGLHGSVASTEGQREADPTQKSSANSSWADHVPDSASESVTLKEVALAPSGLYHGRRYHEWPYYVSLEGWLANGGTEEDYHWRPEPKYSAPSGDAA